MKLYLIILSSLVFLSACKMQQDPIADAPQAVREGRPPSAEKPVAAKPLPKEALQIDAPSLVNGRVGAPVEFKILGRVMTPDVTYRIIVDNLADFPGATFDATTGEFKWTPVKSLMGGFPSIELPVRITLVTEVTKDSPTVSVEKKTITLVIVNAYSKPIINTVTGSSPVMTGGTHVFKFELEDVDALSASDVSVDVRDCTTGYYSDSIAHKVDIRRIESMSNKANSYSGEAVLDLSSVGYLPSGTYCFGLMAVSKHGVVSDIYKQEISIEAKMKATKITMETIPTLTVGEKMQISFSIFDPLGVGQVSIQSMDDIAQLLPGSNLTCKQAFSSKFQIDCAGLIDATNAQPKSYKLNIVTENAGTRATQKTVTNHFLRIQVKAATP